MTRRMMLASGGVLATGSALAQAGSQPISGNRGASDPGPRNIPVEIENPDAMASPATDAGSIPNFK